ncbi:MAG: universal stress protein [Acidobacteriota bacterium]
MNAERLQRWANPKLLLVATNLADEAVLTCEAALQARQSGAKVLLVHVLRPPSLQANLSPAPNSRILTSRGAAAWDVLLRMAKMIEWQGALCEPVLLEGEPVEQISALIERRGVDRVLVATRSGRGLERLLAGSIADALIGALDVPVTLIGPRARMNPFRGVAGGQVLLTLSLEHDRADCVEFAASLAFGRRSALTLMHVLDVSGFDDAEKETARGVAHASIVSLMHHVKGPLPPFSITIREGPPHLEILRADVCPGWDIIIMGSPSPGIVSKLLGASVAHRVIAAANCPVITLRNTVAKRLTVIPNDAELRFLDREEMMASGRNH